MVRDVLHDGDLAEAVDRIRDLGWKGVLGNTQRAAITRDVASTGNAMDKLDDTQRAVWRFEIPGARLPMACGWTTLP